MAYTPPAGSAAGFAFTGVAYTSPAGNAANSSFVTDFRAVGNVVLGDLIAVGVAIHSASGGATVTAQGDVTLGALIASGVVAHGITSAGVATLGDLIAVGAALHPRHSLRGEVRNAGVLVNRTVRAYRRDNGAFLGEQLTTTGRFDIHTGFAEIECYVLPIDLNTDADDYTPPVSNRVISVLAQD